MKILCITSRYCQLCNRLISDSENYYTHMLYCTGF